MRALLVVNPKATTTSARVRDVLVHALAGSTKLDVAETTSRGHATALARQATLDGLDVVVALGGDGTVNEVVNGLLHAGPASGLPALGVVPAGGTNVFARSLGLPNSAVEATSHLLAALAADRRRRIGLGLADERWFTFCAGLGIDAGAVQRVEATRAAGQRGTPSRYVRAAVRELYTGPTRRRPVLTLQRPDEDPVAVAIALVCNADPWTYLGRHPVRPCPEASYDAGLDVFALRRLSTVGTVRHFSQMLAAQPRPRGRRVVRGHDLTELTLVSDGERGAHGERGAGRELALQVDGDLVGARTTVRFRSVPDALDVLV